nr:MAG TPA: GDSL-like Lipase/Acylhydrolase [Caudoviricetes sp.]
MQKIRIDFDNPGLPQHISAVENDSQSRFFQATLYENGKAYTAPEGAAYSIMYRGFGPQNQGWYDTINDGAGKRAACAVSGNVVTCEIARQALQVPGHVSIVLCVTTGKGYMLKSWPIECDCKNDRYDSTAEIQSFFYITQVSNADWTQAIQAWENLKTAIDPTLSLSGKAADAKATGDAVDELKKDVHNIKQSIGAITLVNPFSRYGNFESSSDWYCTNGTIGVADNVATFTANSQFAGIRPLINSTAEYKTRIIKNHAYYFFATIKSQKSDAFLSFNAGGGLGGASTKGTGDWEFIDALRKATFDDAQPLSVTDNNSEYGSAISVKHMGYVDLTECYGAGNEPEYDTIHRVLIKNNYWIDEKTSVFPDIQEKLSKLENDVIELKTLPEKLSNCKVFIFGDSITATNLIRDDGSLTATQTNWPNYAMAELSIANWYNFAKDGSTYHDVAGSSNYQTFYKQFELAKSNDVIPDIIIVSYGTNDYQYPNTDTYESVMNVQNIDDLDRTNLHGALRYCYWSLREKYPNAVIFAGTPIQRPDTLIYTDLRQAIIEMANTYCIHIIDAGVESGICKQFETWGSSGRYLKDGLHPNEAGQKLQGHYYANCIRNMF